MVATMEKKNLAKLSGTFICADYCNEWTDEKYDEEMGYLKELGMEYIVLMSLVLKQANGNFNVGYPTQVGEAKDYYRGSDVLDKMLSHAEKYGIKVFIGLNLHDDWWPLWWDYDKLEEAQERLFEQMHIGNQMADEIYANYYHKYPKSFYGWYWMWECWNFSIMQIAEPGRRQCIKILADAININLDHLTEIDSTLPCLLSPFVNTDLTTSVDLEHMWKDFFALTHFRYGDIFCAQDSCGAGGQKLKDLREWYGAYARAEATKPGLRMWANNENFNQYDWGTMTLDHYIKQLQITDEFVDVHVSFSYLHYYSPGHTRHMGWHNAYKQYLETGDLSYDCPQAVENLQAETVSEDTVKLHWSHPNTDEISGCRIYRHYVFIGRV